MGLKGIGTKRCFVLHRRAIHGIFSLGFMRFNRLAGDLLREHYSPINQHICSSIQINGQPFISKEALGSMLDALQ